MLIRDTYCNDTAVLRIALCSLNSSSLIVRECLTLLNHIATLVLYRVCPYIVSILVKTRSNTIFSNGRNKRHINLHSSQSEDLRKQYLFSICVCREPLGSKFSKQLHIVKVHMSNKVRERLESHSTNCICLFYIKLLVVLENVIEILNITERSLWTSLSFL